MSNRRHAEGIIMLYVDKVLSIALGQGQLLLGVRNR